MRRCSIVVVAALLVGRVAWADDHERAVAAFDEGRQLIEQGDCKAAVPKFRESLTHERSVSALVDIASCIEKEADPLASWRVLEEAAALASMTHDPRLASIEQRTAALESRLAMIAFKLPGAAQQSGFELRVDGELVDRYLYHGGYATTPGAHRIEARTPGGHFAKTVTVEASARTPVEVVLERDAPPPPVMVVTPSAAEPSDRGAHRRTLGLVLGGIGLAGLATGTVFGLMTLDKKSALEDACGGSLDACRAPDGSLDEETSAAKATSAISTVGFVLGGVALLGATIIYLTSPSPRSRAAWLPMRRLF